MHTEVLSTEKEVAQLGDERVIHSHSPQTFPKHIRCAAMSQNLDQYIFQQRKTETFQAEETTYT